MYSGESQVLNFTIRDDAGALLDLTGGTLRWGFALNSFGSPYLTKRTPTASGISFTVAASGTFAVTLSPVDTSGYIGDYFHEVRYIDSQGNESVLTQGQIQILPSLLLRG